MNNSQTTRRLSLYIQQELPESKDYNEKDEKLQTIKSLAPHGMVPYPLFNGFSPLIWIYNRFIAPKIKSLRNRDNLLQLKMD